MREVCAGATTSFVQKINGTMRGKIEQQIVSLGRQDTFKSFMCHDLFPGAMGGGKLSFEGG